MWCIYTGLSTHKPELLCVYFFVLAESEATNNSFATLSGLPYAAVNATVEFKLSSILPVLTHPHSGYMCICWIAIAI